MDDYPKLYVDIPRPFVVISGLGSEINHDVQSSNPIYSNGLKLEVDIPLATGPRAETLLSELKIFGKAHAESNVVKGSESSGQPSGYNVKVHGRAYSFPPRKASPQASPAELMPDTASTPTSPSNQALHSTLSPLSAGSPLYPDGIMNTIWIEKHLSVVPTIIIACFTFGSDPERNSLNDNQLKSQLLAMKSFIEASKYRTRLAVILVGEQVSPLEATEIDDRIQQIARSARLDPKSAMFYLPNNSSEVEVRTFAETVFSTIRPTIMDYYRDLSRHTRRKRDKNSTSGNFMTTKTQGGITRHGWLARYEYKLATLAEFRSEMDVADKHFALASKALFDSEAVFDKTDSWSKRWDEIRIFSDILAIHQITCLLKLNSPTTAIRVWRTHRNKTRDLLNRKAKGTGNYGWKVWESRWASIMATLIDQNMPSESERPQRDPGAQPLASGTIAFYAMEKFVAEDVPKVPYDYLHHAGYWRVLESHLLKSRRHLALEMPEDDRNPPDQSPATQVARRNDKYDLYLCSEPNVEYEEAILPNGNQSKQIQSSLESAMSVFLRKAQYRQAAQHRIDLCKELVRSSNFSTAITILESLWKDNFWRHECWLINLREIDHLLYICARETHRTALVVASLWELSSDVFEPVEDMQYDLQNIVTDRPIESAEEVDIFNVTSSDTWSPVKISFNFVDTEGHAGETLRAQIVLHSTVQSVAKPIIFKSLIIRFDGSLQSITINNGHEDPDDETNVSISQIPLKDISETRDASDRSHYAGEASLVVAPGKVTILDIETIVREPGEILATEAVLSLSGMLPFSYVEQLQVNHVPSPWWTKSRTGSKCVVLKNDPTKVTVLPKPPKMRIEMPSLRSMYYSGETSKIEVELTNAESDEAATTIEIQILGGPHDAPALWWDVEDSQASPEHDSSAFLNSSLGNLSVAESRRVTFVVDVPHGASEMILEVRAVYHLISDPETRLLKSLASELAVVQPFEARYDVTADIHEDPWPSIFELNSESGHPQLNGKGSGITTRWHLNTILASRAREQLRLDKIELLVDSAANVILEVSDPTIDGDTISPTEHQRHVFVIDVTSPEIDQSKMVKLESTLQVFWRRLHGSAGENFRQSISVPLLSLPCNEPRVLAAQKNKDEDSVLLHLTIENPSLHSLTFSLVMEPNETFAFSGPKSITVQLMPLSRREISYLLIAFVKGDFLRPDLKVMDTYFNKLLRLLPTGGMTAEAGNLAIWIDSDD